MALVSEGYSAPLLERCFHPLRLCLCQVDTGARSVGRVKGEGSLTSPRMLPSISRLFSDLGSLLLTSLSIRTVTTFSAWPKTEREP